MIQLIVFLLVTHDSKLNWCFFVLFLLPEYVCPNETFEQTFFSFANGLHGTVVRLSSAKVQKYFFGICGHLNKAVMSKKTCCSKLAKNNKNKNTMHINCTCHI